MKTWIPDERNFAYLNWKQVDALPRESTLLVLPTAAIEQHGHHLPLATDTLINNLLLGQALRKIARRYARLRAAAGALRQEQRAHRFSGNPFAQRSTFMAVLRDLGSSLSKAGFRKLVLYNTHGGNTSLIDVMSRDLRAEFGCERLRCTARVEFRLKASILRSARTGFTRAKSKHLSSGSVPELVDRSAYTANYIADISKPAMLLPENAPATFAWLPVTLRRAA